MNATSESVDHPYTLVISRKTVDRLGVKLYDKPSAVIGELIANSYDADAEEVRVRLPLKVWLATWRKQNDIKVVVDRGFEIVVEDDGHGMTPQEANAYYLKVGFERRAVLGNYSRDKNRRVMGRKGIGKLAPFGICQEIEVWSAGGEESDRGYEVSHFVLRYDDIMSDTDEPYHPRPGTEDGTYVQKPGTRVILRDFLPHRVPDRDTFHRQLARRYALRLPDFGVDVEDATGETEPFGVGELEVEVLEGTLIQLDDREVVVKEEGLEERRLPIRGWVAYSKEPYRNEEMAGVRIYAWGKLAAVTRDFGIRSGFTGENVVRSYLIGEIYADWIDEDEDFIRTDRQDILWNSAIGQAFREWGQGVIQELGNRARGPGRKARWKSFQEVSDLEAYAKVAYSDPKIQAAVMDIGGIFASVMSQDDIEDLAYVGQIRELILAVAPHKYLVDALREIREEVDKPLDVLIRLFRNAGIAEKASLGQIVKERLDIIQELEKKIDASVPEPELQQLIEEAPWLLQPQWTALTKNQPMERFRSAFERWHRKHYKKKIITSAIEHPSRKPDFIFIRISGQLLIVEIKRPDHRLTDVEFDRVLIYLESVENFLEQNSEFALEFGTVKAVLVCDDYSLGRMASEAFERRKENGTLLPRTWEDVLSRTKKVHEAFLPVHDRRTEAEPERKS